MPRGLQALAIIALAAWCSGCGDDHSRPASVDLTPARFDSAGISVVTYRVAQLDAVPRIEPDTSPTLSIGAADGPPGEVLHQVGSILGRADGGMVVADDGGTVLRAYDAYGRYLQSHGRQGEGPGEYRRISGMAWLRGDSLIVFDFRNSRASVLDPELRFVRSVRLPTGLDAPSGIFGSWSTTQVLGIGPGKVALLASRPHDPGRAIASPQPHARQDTFSVLMLRPNMESFAVDTVSRMPGGRWMVYPQPNGARSSGLIYTASPFLAASPSGFVTAHGSRFELHRFDSEGTLRLVIRVDAQARAVTHQERKRFEESWRERNRQPRPAGSPEPLPPVFEDRHPLLNEVELDAAGNIWVRPDTSVARDRGWLVFAPDGEIRAWVSTLAPRGSIRYVGSDHVLVVATDTMQIPRVVRYAIPKWP